MTPKTWDEVVEIAARAICDHVASDQFEALSDADRADLIAETETALRALRAAGLAVVPREATEAMQEAARLARYEGNATYASVVDAALSAGELAPPDKGEG